MVNISFLLTAVQQMQSTLTLHCLVQNTKIRRKIISWWTLGIPKSRPWYGMDFSGICTHLHDYTSTYNVQYRKSYFRKKSVGGAPLFGLVSAAKQSMGFRALSLKQLHSIMEFHKIFLLHHRWLLYFKGWQWTVTNSAPTRFSSKKFNSMMLVKKIT